MQKRKNRLRGLCLFLVFLLGFSQATDAATQFPGGGRAWNKIPAIVVLGQEGDWRNQLVIDGVDFWNQQLAEIGSGFRLGPVTFVSQIIPPAELAALSEATLAAERVLEPPSALMQVEGDLIIALSDWAFVSFATFFPKVGKRLIGISTFQRSPLRFTNVGRNVVAHELGHAIGLRHNDDPSKLMCGRPASCRPDAFRSDVEHYFPLMEEEKQYLLKLYPPTWK
jgi:Matrixin